MEDGKAYPKYPLLDHLLNLRARKSIEILNLNDHKITEVRREIWLRCMRLIRRGDEAFIQYKAGSISGTQQFKDVIEEMRELIKSSAEFSATARACFRGSPYNWVRETVT